MTAAPQDTTPVALDLEEALRGIPAAAALPPAVFAELVRHVHAELEIRVGARLSRGLTDAQLDEFEELVRYEETHPEAASSDGPATAWLEAHQPDYRRIVLTELQALIAETSTILGRTRRPGEPGPMG